MGYKLLKHSQHQYDVCSSVSSQWGYNETLPMDADNITPFTIETDDISEWSDYCLEVFEREHAKNPYDCYMTRSMPPESINFGREIKKRHPELPWIASLADPISRVPGMLKAYLDKTKALSKSEKKTFSAALFGATNCEQWCDHPDIGIRSLAQYKELEDFALRNADMLIMPNGAQANFMLCGRPANNIYVIPHSFDPSMFPTPDTKKSDVIELAFFGFADESRSLEPLVQAVHLLGINNPSALKNIHISLVGNIVDRSNLLVNNFYLNDVISIEPSVSYTDSLKMMQEVDWLVHTDGHFGIYAKTGGSVYFAGKLADYLGSGKPILGITGRYTPGDRLIKQAGGICVERNDVGGLAFILEQIAQGTLSVKVNDGIRNRYSSENVGRMLDSAIEEHFSSSRGKHRGKWPAPIEHADCKPCLSICIPSYNVESYLDRCLLSLVSSNRADLLEIIVVDDGSSDGTLEIAQMYQERYPEIVKVISKENGGHGSTINAALAVASGRYFRVVDGDDWLETRQLDKLISSLDGRESTIDIVVSDYSRVDISSGHITRTKKKDSRLAYDCVYELSAIDISKEYLSIHGITYRTAMLQDAGVRLLEHSYYVDVEYQLYPLLYAKTILFTSGDLYRYAIGSSEQSISKSSFVAKYDQHDRVIKNVIDYYGAHNQEMLPPVRDYYHRLILNYLLVTHYSIALVYDSNRSRGFQRAKEFDHYLKSTDPALFNEVGAKYSTIDQLRACSYDSNIMPSISSLKMRFPSSFKKHVHKLIKKAMHGHIGDIVASEVKRRK